MSKEFTPDVGAFRAVLNSAEEAVALLSPDGTVLAVNAAALRFEGAPEEEMVGKPLWEGPRTKANPAMGRAIRLALERVASSTDMETAAQGLLPSPGGRFLQLSAQGIRDDAGNLAYLVFSARDVTSEQRAQDDLRSSEAQFRALAEDSQDTIMRFDREGRHLYANPVVEKVTGIPREQFIGKTHAELGFPEHLINQWEPAIQRVFETAESERMEFQLPNGLWIDWSIVPEFDAEGRVQAVMTSARDVTELKARERELQEARERYQFLADNATDLIWRMSVPELRFMDINPAVESVLGYTREEFLGLRLENLLQGVWLDKAVSILKSAIEDAVRSGEEITQSFECEHVRKDGSTLWADVNARLVRGPDGKPTAVVGVTRDVTERRRAEQEARQSQKMEAIGNLAGGIAHDFNNLLTGISGNVELALLDISPNDPLHETLREVLRAADSAAGLTRQLLAFSRKEMVAPRIVQPEFLIEQLSRMLRRLIGENIELHIRMAEGLGCVRIDPNQLEQALVNLVVNARDAMPSGGSLTIRGQNVKLDEAFCQSTEGLKPGDYVRLEVEDTGVGMDAATLARAFEPFYTTKKKGRGTGLGLSTTYGVVRQNDGHIEAESQPGKGSTFRVYLPMVPDEAGDKTAKQGKVHGKADETILLVEDEELVRRIAAKALQRAGYSVVEAEHGGQALHEAERHEGPIHLLVTDVVMPGMNGRQLADRLLETMPELRVLFTSGYTDDAILAHGVLEEGVHFLEKPYSPRSLNHAVRKVLDE